MKLEQDFVLNPNPLRYGTGEKVFSYYDAIDRFDKGEAELDEVLSLFHPGVLYNRGNISLEGYGQMSNFYLYGRRIKGEHVLSSMTETPAGVYVAGKFVGQKDNLPISEFFNDSFFFGPEGLVILRWSHFPRGVQI